LARAYIKFESLEKKETFLRNYKPVFIDGKGEKWNPVVEEALYDFLPAEAGEPNPLEGSYEQSIHRYIADQLIFGSLLIFHFVR
jgi:hypothetical protein